MKLRLFYLDFSTIPGVGPLWRHFVIAPSLPESKLVCKIGNKLDSVNGKASVSTAAAAVVNNSEKNHVTVKSHLKLTLKVNDF